MNANQEGKNYFLKSVQSSNADFLGLRNEMLPPLELLKVTLIQMGEHANTVNGWSNIRHLFFDPRPSCLQGLSDGEVG